MAATQQTRDPSARHRALAAIHIAKTQLGLDDAAYRAIIRRVSASHGAEVDSAGRLDRTQMVAVLEEFRRLGAARPGAHKPAHYPGRPHNLESPRMPAMIEKVQAQLADMGLTWAYADAIAKRQCGIARLAWVRSPEQLRGIIAALDVEQEKRGRNACIAASLAKLGMGEKQLVDLTASMPKNWRRNRRCLKAVCDQLGARLAMLAEQERPA